MLRKEDQVSHLQWQGKSGVSDVSDQDQTFLVPQHKNGSSLMTLAPCPSTQKFVSINTVFAPPQEKAAKSFDAFLQEFIRTYEDWTPPDTPGEIAGGTAAFVSEDLRTPVSGCETGHPTRVVVGFVQELKNVTRIVTDGEQRTCVH